MKRLFSILATVSALTATLALRPTAAWAGPEISEWSHRVDLDADSCAKRARWAFAQDGWAGIQNGSGDIVMADKGPLGGMIICLGGGLFDNQCTAVIVVTGGDGDAAPESVTLRKLVVGK